MPEMEEQVPAVLGDVFKCAEWSSVLWRVDQTPPEYDHVRLVSSSGLFMTVGPEDKWVFVASGKAAADLWAPIGVAWRVEGAV